MSNKSGLTTERVHFVPGQLTEKQVARLRDVWILKLHKCRIKQQVESNSAYPAAG